MLSPSEIDAIKLKLELWGYASYIATGLVLIATLGEYIATFTSISKKFIENKKLEKLCTLILITSIVIELPALVQMSNLSGHLIASIENATETARLELVKYRTPRRIDNKLAAQISEKLGSEKEAFVAVAADGAEALDLALDTGRTLKSLGWEWLDWPAKPGESITSLPNLPIIGVQTLDGIDIRALHPDLLDEAQALTKIFSDAGWEKVRVGHPETAAQINLPILLVIVGVKP